MLYNAEHKMMKKFGLSIDDFEGEDWRDIFDLYSHKINHLVVKYVGSSRSDKFYRELYDF